MSLESTRYENTKKSDSNMRNYFEESRYSQIFSSQESSYLDNSTVPTYEEFMTKTNKPVIPDASLASIMTQTLIISDNQMSSSSSQSSNECNSQNSNYKFKNNVANTVNATLTGNSLVTDDETDSEENGVVAKNEVKPSYQQQPPQALQILKLTQTPSRTLATPIKRNETPFRMAQTPRLKQEENCKRTQPNSPCEYVIYDNKIAQTSFALSVSYNDEANSEDDYDKVKQDEHHDDLIINDSIENTSVNSTTSSRTKEHITCNQIEQTKFESFKLHLSEESDHNTNQIQNPTNSSSSKERNYDESHVTMRKNRTRNVKTNKRNNKRVSICGDHLSENVLKIDDTIIDEYDNELDFKSGKLVSLGESTALDALTVTDTESSSLQATSNEVKKRKEDVHSSSSEDRFEQFLKEHKNGRTRETTWKENKKSNDLRDFIVEDDESIEDEMSEENEDKSLSSSVQSDDEIVEKKPISRSRKTLKQIKDKKKRQNAVKNILSTTSSESNTSNDSDLEEYEQDLQLFYIRTTKTLNDNDSLNENSKSKKKNFSRSSLLDDDDDDDQQYAEVKKQNNKSHVSISSSSDSSLSSSLIESPPNNKCHSSSSESSTPLSDDSFRKTFRKNNILTESKFINSNVFQTPSIKKDKKKILENELRLVKTQLVKKPKAQKLSFVESLSVVLEEEELREPSALEYIKKFKNKKVKQELLQMTYEKINKEAFENKLPQDMKLTWNGRLSSTAGFCQNSNKMGIRTCEIHMSMKVCDSAERMRDTLAHEMCHAAAFLINGLLDGHGKIWRYWANRVNITYKKMPRITIKHSYEIKKKYVYRCMRCHNEIHRFSKSIDTEKQICGVCYGRFELMLNDEKKEILEARKNRLFDRLKNDANTEHNELTPSKTNGKKLDTLATPARQINKFAQFVKENYGSTKKDKCLGSHKDVMQELSKQFKQLATK